MTEILDMIRHDGVFVVRLLVAMALGGLAGVERQIRGRAAGLRTNILVCLGSTAIVVAFQKLSVELKLPAASRAESSSAGKSFFIFIRQSQRMHGAEQIHRKLIFMSPYRTACMFMKPHLTSRHLLRLEIFAAERDGGVQPQLLSISFMPLIETSTIQEKDNRTDPSEIRKCRNPIVTPIPVSSPKMFICMPPPKVWQPGSIIVTRKTLSKSSNFVRSKVSFSPSRLDILKTSDSDVKKAASF